MTIVKNYKAYIINGKKWFVEKYADKPEFVWFWRYGYVTNGIAVVVRDQLFSRPRLNRLSL